MSRSARLRGGRAALAIFNVRTGKRDREIPVKGVDEILNPSWAPDGHAIAFTGMRAGLTDLYLFEFGRRAHPAIHERRLCGFASGLVAGQPSHRVRHRSLFELP